MLGYRIEKMATRTLRSKKLVNTSKNNLLCHRILSLFTADCAQSMCNNVRLFDSNVFIISQSIIFELETNFLTSCLRIASGNHLGHLNRELRQGASKLLTF